MWEHIDNVDTLSYWLRPSRSKHCGAIDMDDMLRAAPSLLDAPSRNGEVMNITRGEASRVP